MRAPRADSVYFSIVLLIALAVLSAWSVRASGQPSECGRGCAEQADALAAAPH